MSEEPFGSQGSERDAEKKHGKELEQEKRGGKSWDEKWHRDPLSATVWACVLIWAGLVFLADSL